MRIALHDGQQLPERVFVPILRGERASQRESRLEIARVGRDAGAQRRFVAGAIAAGPERGGEPLRVRHGWRGRSRQLEQPQGLGDVVARGDGRASAKQRIRMARLQLERLAQRRLGGFGRLIGPPAPTSRSAGWAAPSQSTAEPRLRLRPANCRHQRAVAEPFRRGNALDAERLCDAGRFVRR